MKIRTISLLKAFIIVMPFQFSLADPKIVEEEVTLRFSRHAKPEDVYVMIRKKANRVCESRAVYPHLNLSGEARCRRQFIGDAVLAIDNPELTALYRVRTGSEELNLAASEQ
jgi:hypothetical protein